MLIDAVDTQPVEHVQRTHPLRVTLREVVVHRHHMYAITGKGVEEDGERSYQSLTFPGGHLSDLTLVEDRPPEELDVVVHHIPGDLITPSHPMVLVDRRIPFDTYEVMRYAEVSVEVRSLDSDLRVLSQTASSALDDGEGLWMYFVEDHFELVEDILLELVDLRPDRFTLIEVLALDTCLEALHLCTLTRYVVLYTLTKGSRACSQVIIT